MQLKMRQTYALAEIEAMENNITLFKSNKGEVVEYIKHLIEIANELASWYDEDIEKYK